MVKWLWEGKISCLWLLLNLANPKTKTYKNVKLNSLTNFIYLWLQMRKSNWEIFTFHRTVPRERWKTFEIYWTRVVVFPKLLWKLLKRKSEQSVNLRDSNVYSLGTVCTRFILFSDINTKHSLPHRLMISSFLIVRTKRKNLSQNPSKFIGAFYVV